VLHHLYRQHLRADLSFHSSTAASISGGGIWRPRRQFRVVSGTSSITTGTLRWI
jgi:hypothetical protein